MSARAQKPIPRTTFRLIIEERDSGWEVVFYGEDGKVRHISNSRSEIAALRSAHFIARYYHYDQAALLRGRHGDKRINVSELMQNRRASR